MQIAQIAYVHIGSCEEDQLAATGASRPSTPSTRASASKADTISVKSVEGEDAEKTWQENRQS